MSEYLSRTSPDFQVLATHEKPASDFGDENYDRLSLTGHNGHWVSYDCDVVLVLCLIAKVED
jgi:hypothetical protein